MISILGSDDWKVKDNVGIDRGQFGTLKRNTKLYKQFKQILGDLEYDFTKDNMSRILRGANKLHRNRRISICHRRRRKNLKRYYRVRRKNENE